MHLVYFIIYLATVVLININSYGAVINGKYVEQKDGVNYIKPLYTILITIMSLIPMVNTLIGTVITILARKETYLPSYVKHFNEAYKCNKCGCISRAGYSDGFYIYKNWVGDYKLYEYGLNCPLCDSGNYYRASKYDKKNLPNGKKLNFIQLIPVSIRGKYYKSVSQLQKLELKQAEYQFQDEQLAIKQKMAELKLKKFQEERLKLEENKYEN